ncbi:MAG: hypothetical protein F6K55_24105 [Moorea sp. SIO4A3]|nr:hypothetical protein [Moorena sp. SIO4A3]
MGFTLAKWPVIEVEGAATVAEGGNQILLEPGKWICNLMIHLQIREGDQTKPPAELPRGDYLVVNISYNGPHLSTRIRESARISPLAPMRFTYLQDPKGRSSQLYLSANGVLDGQMIRVRQQRIHPDEENVYLLASHNGVQIVSQESPLPENNHSARRLLLELGHIFNLLVDLLWCISSL